MSQNLHLAHKVKDIIMAAKFVDVGIFNQRNRPAVSSICHISEGEKMIVLVSEMNKRRIM